MFNVEQNNLDINKLIKDFMDFQKFMEEQEKKNKDIDKVKKRSGGSVSLIDVPLYSNPRTIEKLVNTIRSNYADGGSSSVDQLKYLIGALQGRPNLDPQEIDLLRQLQAELKLLRKK